MPIVALAAMSIAAPAVAARKRALLIGVESYAHGPTSTFEDTSAGNDVALLRQVLIDKYGFAPTDIVTLTSPKDTTKQAILDAIKADLVDGAQPGDILYFHFSGCGSQVADVYSDTGVDDTLVPYDWTVDGANDIRLPELEPLFADAIAKHPAALLETFDVGHAGSSRGVGFVSRFGRPAPKPLQTKSTRGARMMLRGPRMMLRGDAPTTGFVRITAGDVDSETVDRQGKTVGRLTLALVGALRSAGPGSTYRDVFDAVDERLKLQQPSQTPSIDGDLDTKVLNGTAKP